MVLKSFWVDGIVNCNECAYLNTSYLSCILVESMISGLEREQIDLANEIGRQDRIGATVTDQMYIDSQVNITQLECWYCFYIPCQGNISLAEYKKKKKSPSLLAEQCIRYFRLPVH